MKSVRRFVLPLVGGMAVLGGLGAIYQARADQRDQERYPPPGRRVWVNGRHLHMVCQGQGAPVVVLEAGLGSSHLDWSRVLPEVAEFTTVVAYDRAGSGWSDPVAHPRTARQMVADLRAVLQQAGLAGPYLLVGHSYGGVLVRLYAANFPAEVAGLVLVDSSHEDQKARAPRQALRKQVREDIEWQWFRLRPLLARLGYLRWLEWRKPDPRAALPEDMRPAARWLALRARSHDWLWHEYPAIDPTFDAVRGSRLPGTIAVRLLVGGNDFPDPLWQAAWLELQTDLARKFPQARLQVVEGSGHFIQLDRPQAVVATIRELVAAWREAYDP